MIVGSAVLVRVLLRTIGHEMHLVHDPPAFLHGNGDPVVPPQKSPEGPLARHIAELFHDLPEHILQLLFFHVFRGPGFLQLLAPGLPCTVAGTGDAEHTATLLL